MTRDEKLVANFLASKGLRAEEFSKKEKAQSKTPDFRVFHGQDLALICEVKSLSRDERFGLHPDPTLNRLSNKIYEAAKQFVAVNQDFAHPNVLAFVNHDSSIGITDLREALTGELVLEGGQRFSTSKKISEGRIREKKGKIHLYLWIDVINGQIKDFGIYNLDDHRILNRLCSYFGHDPDEIRAAVS
jgi:hypothetical protein